MTELTHSQGMMDDDESEERDKAHRTENRYHIISVVLKISLKIEVHNIVLASAFSLLRFLNSVLKSIL